VSGKKGKKGGSAHEEVHYRGRTGGDLSEKYEDAKSLLRPGKTSDVYLSGRSGQGSLSHGS